MSQTFLFLGAPFSRLSLHLFSDPLLEPIIFFYPISFNREIPILVCRSASPRGAPTPLIPQDFSSRPFLFLLSQTPSISGALVFSVRTSHERADFPVLNHLSPAVGVFFFLRLSRLVTTIFLTRSRSNQKHCRLFFSGPPPLHNTLRNSRLLSFPLWAPSARFDLFRKVHSIQSVLLMTPFFLVHFSLHHQSLFWFFFH